MVPKTAVWVRLGVGQVHPGISQIRSVSIRGEAHPSPVAPGNLPHNRYNAAASRGRNATPCSHACDR